MRVLCCRRGGGRLRVGAVSWGRRWCRPPRPARTVVAPSRAKTPSSSTSASTQGSGPTSAACVAMPSSTAWPWAATGSSAPRSFWLALTPRTAWPLTNPKSDWPPRPLSGHEVKPPRAWDLCLGILVLSLLFFLPGVGAAVTSSALCRPWLRSQENVIPGREPSFFYFFYCIVGFFPVCFYFFSVCGNTGPPEGSAWE